MKVLIVKNIARESPGLLLKILEENKIEFYIYEYEKDRAFPSPEDYGAIFVFGGPDSANDKTEKMTKEIRGVKEFLAKRIPFLGYA